MNPLGDWRGGASGHRFRSSGWSGPEARGSTGRGEAQAEDRPAEPFTATQHLEIIVPKGMPEGSGKLKLIEFLRSMGILVPTLLLLLAACALALLHVARPRFRFSWLLAVGAALAAWLVALTMRSQLPSQLDVPLWRSSISAASYATFTVGMTTWPYMIGMASVAVTFMLAAPGRPRFPSVTTWAICLMLASLGTLALAADSPLTLIILWAALDLVEGGILLARLENRSSSLQVPFAFSLRLTSIGLVMLAFVLGDPSSAGAKFVDIQSPAAMALLHMAALLRLGAFAIPWPKEVALGPDDVGSLLQLTAGTASVGFLSQLTAQAGDLSILVLCCLVTLYAGWMFLRTAELTEARPLWIMGMGSLSVAASLQGNPTGAAAWGIAILLAGSPLFANSMPERWARRALLPALWITSALPFSLTAAAWSLAGMQSIWSIPILVVGQAMLLAGSFHQALKVQAGSAWRVEVLALKGIQYAAIGLPLLAGFLLGLWGWPGSFQTGTPLAGLLLIPLAVGLALAKRRLPILNPASGDWYPRWLTATAQLTMREASRAGGSLQRLAGGITRTMEGEAGIMWGLLFLVLFVSLIAGGNP